MIPLTAEWAKAAEDVQKEAFPPPFPQEDLFTADDFIFNAERFPKGQFGVILEEPSQSDRGSDSPASPKSELLAATCTNMIVFEDSWQKAASWKELVGGLRIARHDPGGKVMFGVDISVRIGCRRKGIARMLYEARFRLAKELGLRTFATACRIPGLASRPELSPEAFCSQVCSGEIVDSPMTPLMRLGMTFRGVRREFMPDPPSRNCCAILERVIQ